MRDLSRQEDTAPFNKLYLVMPWKQKKKYMGNIHNLDLKKKKIFPEINEFGMFSLSNLTFPLAVHVWYLSCRLFLSKTWIFKASFLKVPRVRRFTQQLWGYIWSWNSMQVSAFALRNLQQLLRAERLRCAGTFCSGCFGSCCSQTARWCLETGSCHPGKLLVALWVLCFSVGHASCVCQVLAIFPLFLSLDGPLLNSPLLTLVWSKQATQEHVFVPQ